MKLSAWVRIPHLPPIGDQFRGRTNDSKSLDEGSIPSSPAMRLSYNGQYKTLPRFGCEFDSRKSLHLSFLMIRLNALVMELVYILVLESRFQEFESLQGHQKKLKKFLTIDLIYDIIQLSKKEGTPSMIQRGTVRATSCLWYRFNSCYKISVSTWKYIGSTPIRF